MGHSNDYETASVTRPYKNPGVKNCSCVKPIPSFRTMMSLVPAWVSAGLKVRTERACRNWIAGLLWEMMTNQLSGEVHTCSLVAAQEFPETLMWPHSWRCSIHGQEQSLVQRIYNHDAAAIFLLHVPLVISNDVLFIVNLPLFPTNAFQCCFPKLQVLNSCMWKDGSWCESKQRELVRWLPGERELEQLPCSR